MFDRLAGCNEAGIDRRAFAEFLDRLVAFRDDANDRLAGLALGPLAPTISNTCSRRSIWPCVSSQWVVKAFPLGRLHHLGEGPIIFFSA